MNTKNKTLNLILALFINAGVITSCSQTPTTAPNAQSNPAGTINSSNNVNTTSSGSSVNSGSSSIGTVSQLQMNDSKEITDFYNDDEKSVKDSETIANNQDNFATKSVVVTNENQVTVGAKADINVKKTLDEERKEREQQINDKEKVILARIKLLEAKLILTKDLVKDKLEKLERKDVTVKISDTLVVKNDDGTTTKTISISFQNKNDITFRENKVSQTFSTDGKLIRIEHYLTVTNNEFTRTYLKIVDINADGSRNITIKSETIWTNGKTRTVNEVRFIDVNGNGSGTGTVVIKMPNGEAIVYDIKITISGNINVIINPVPIPSPVISPSSIPAPSVIPSNGPSPSPLPTSTASPTASPTSENRLKGFLSGLVNIGPLCPVEPCNLSDDQLKKIYESHKFQVYNSTRTEVVAEFNADKNGSYKIELSEGTYIVDTVHAEVGSVNLPQTVKIESGNTTTLNINIDTGIR